MGSGEPRWLHSGIDDETATELLARLASDDELRTRLEDDPRTVLLREFHIDFPAAPGTVRLPPPEVISHYVHELRKELPFGRHFNIPHGIVLMWVAHGNGMHPKPKPPHPPGPGQDEPAT
jgi:hypothetical protein